MSTGHRSESRDSADICYHNCNAKANCETQGEKYVRVKGFDSRDTSLE